MRLGIVNDSAMAVEILRQVVEREHQVLWVARNGREAVEKCARETPDALLMDLLMPELDGVEATRRIMKASPCAVLIVTASVGRNTSRVFEALGAGALDVVRTPMIRGADGEQRLLLNKLRTIEKLVGSERRGAGPLPPPPAPAGGAAPLVAVGASSGGPAALATLLSDLPRDFPAAVAVVQHIDRDFASGLAEWLNSRSRLPVALAKHRERPAPGRVYLSEGGRHLVATAMGVLAYTEEPKDSIHVPSVDVFFRSVASHWRSTVVGVILTGMGRDGAEGLRAMVDRGGLGIAQDQATSAIFGMPGAAIRAGGASEVLPLEAIPPRLVQLFDKAAAVR